MSAVSKGPIDDNPYTGAFAITKSDTVEFTYVTKAIWCDVAGDVACVFADGTTATFTLAARTVYRFALKRVAATGTSATGIIGLT